MELMILFGTKFVDKFLATTKNILLIKGKGTASALVDTLGFVVFAMLTKMIVSVDSPVQYAVLAVSTFCGCMFSKYVTTKFEKDKKWLHFVQANNRKQAKIVFDELRDAGVKVITWDSYNDDLRQTLMAIVETNTKAETKMLKGLLEVVGNNEITITNVINI